MNWDWEQLKLWLIYFAILGTGIGIALSIKGGGGGGFDDFTYRR